MTDGTTIPGVKNLIVVASGKGGVGKTTVAVNLAIALQRMGAAVGLLDADVYGPNVPMMLGATEPPRAESERVILPVESYRLKMISMGLLNSADKPVIWRGPMLHSVIQQFLRSVKWGELDYLIVDLPPGTGDVQLTLIQSVVVSGAVIVTTPSMVALADVRKAIEMFRQLKVEILGVVENMSYFNCPHCNARIDIFGHGEGERMAQTFKVPFLGEIEIDPQIRVGGDTGKPVAALGEDAPGAKSLYAMARQVAGQSERCQPLRHRFTCSNLINHGISLRHLALNNCLPTRGFAWPAHGQLACFGDGPLQPSLPILHAGERLPLAGA